MNEAVISHVLFSLKKTSIALAPLGQRRGQEVRNYLFITSSMIKLPPSICSALQQVALSSQAERVPTSIGAGIPSHGILRLFGLKQKKSSLLLLRDGMEKEVSQGLTIFCSYFL